MGEKWGYDKDQLMQQIVPGYMFKDKTNTFTSVCNPKGGRREMQFQLFGTHAGTPVDLFKISSNRLFLMEEAYFWSAKSYPVGGPEKVLNVTTFGFDEQILIGE